MQRIALGVKILLAVGLLGCSSASTPAAPGGGDNVIPPIGNEGDGGSGGSGLGGVGGNGAGGAGGAVSQGACDNPTDEAALAAVRTPNDNARGVSARCAIPECSNVFGQGQAAVIECVTDCVQGNIRGLSFECSACYGALAWCAGFNCNTACAESGPCANDCLGCDESGAGGPNYEVCLDQLTLCTGRPSRECD